MAQGNGGIIGPVQTVTAAACQSEVITEKTASGNITVQPATTAVSSLIIAGGGSGVMMLEVVVVLEVC